MKSRHRRLRALHARLYGQLDQRVGREKRILRAYLAALSRRLKREGEHQTEARGSQAPEGAETQEDRSHA